MLKNLGAEPIPVDVERRVIAGEVIAIVDVGSRCTACADVARGAIPSCPCGNRKTQWGYLVMHNEGGRAAMRYMTRDELFEQHRAGKPMVRASNGETMLAAPQLEATQC